MEKKEEEKLTTPPPPPVPEIEPLPDSSPDAPPFTLPLYSLLICLEDTAHLSEDGHPHPAIRALEQVGTPARLIAALWYNVELTHTPED